MPLLGRISRFLANKCSVASRIDAFSDSTPTSKWGEALKRQVDERIEFYASGATPAKNSTVMQGVLADLQLEDATSNGDEATELAIRKKKEKKEKKKSKEVEPEEQATEKKSKKDKKRRNGDDEDGEGKKKKKKSKSA